MIKLIISGVAGRMGKRIANLAFTNPEIKIVAGLEMPGHVTIGEDLGKLLGLGEKGIKIVD